MDLKSRFFLVTILTLLTGCSNYEFISKDEINKRINEKVRELVNIREAELRKEILASLEKEEKDDARHEIDEPETEKEVIDANLRGTRWGMSMQEVQDVEKDDYIKKSSKALFYRDKTADLPSIIQYIFHEDKLVKAKIFFADPKLSRILPSKTFLKAESEYAYIEELLCNKYGPAQTETNLFSNIENLKRKQQELADEVLKYQRELEDKNEEANRASKDLQKKYDGWNNARSIIKKEMEPYETAKRRLRDWVKEVTRQKSDIDIEIRKEEQRKKDDLLPKTIASSWYKPGFFDVDLKYAESTKGPVLYVQYNGFVSENTSVVPSDL
ncbi:MAG: hypothetical protein EOM20_06500 [Spartobacteria bacterium]|nr:hypothetical protein [Spartobacteria bacterium]